MSPIAHPKSSPPARPGSWLAALLAACAVSTAPAQPVLNFPVTASVAADSPTGGLHPADVYTLKDGSPAAIAYMLSNLNLPTVPPSEADGIAFSRGMDVFPADGIDASWEREIYCEYTLAPPSLGAEGTQIATVGGTNVGSYVFGVKSADGVVYDPAIVEEQPGDIPAATAMDVLDWEAPTGRAWFCVDADFPASPVWIPFCAGGMIEYPVTRATVFESTSPGSWCLNEVFNQMGLGPGDWITALAVNRTTSQVVFALGPGSPRLQTIPAVTVSGLTTNLVTSADLLIYVPPGGPITGIRLWGPSEVLGLRDGDQLNGVRIADPMHPHAYGTYLPPAGSYPGSSETWAMMKVSSAGIGPTDGGRLRRVRIGLNTPYVIDLALVLPLTSNPNDVVVPGTLFVLPGIPTYLQSAAASWGSLFAVADPATYPGMTYMSVDVPDSIVMPASAVPATFTFQALWWDGSTAHTTNALTVVID